MQNANTRLYAPSTPVITRRTPAYTPLRRVYAWLGFVVLLAAIPTTLTAIAYYFI